MDTIDDAKAAAMCLREKGCKNVILTLGIPFLSTRTCLANILHSVACVGSRGSMLVNEDHPDGLFVPTTKVDAIDTVGAGDCFCGAFAHFYTEGHPS